MKKVGRKAASILLTLCMLLTMLPVSALAADEGTVDTAPAETNLAEPVNTGNSSSDEGEPPVSTLVAGTEDSVDYVDEDGQTQTCTEYTTVAANTTTWSNGWYVVTGTVTLDDRVEVSDSVNLILADGAELNATKGIGVTYDNSLTIYGQSEGTGKLTAGAYQVYNSAAIGGTDYKGQNRNLCAHGDITINGGDITATGASAGIGGGGSATGTSGTITINGGTVKATGGSDAAGIGGGYANTTNGGAIIINGGTVTATGGSKAAGIGAGYSGAGGMKITITGGKVTATGGSNDTYGGAGIGANYGGSTNPVSITITGSADVTATGGLGAAGIGGGSGNAEAAVDTIVIDGSAKVHATGGNSDTYGGAGIGAGGSGACGSITISGGAKVTATGGAGSSYGGAGIGAGGKGPCDSITISGSADVTAVGGAGDTRGGAGIGAGGGINIDGSYRPIPSCNRIEITGGTVDATGGEDSGSSKGADGIGGNSSTSSTVGSVSISGGAFTANTFDKGIPDGYLAEGFTLVENEDGTWGVTKDDTTTDTGVAQIGNQTYATLEQAFGAVGSEAVTIKLLADTQISNAIEVAAGETIVLDLNGYAVTVPAAGSDGRSLYAISNNGTLTICDNSTEQDGSITARGIQNIGNGILTINSGTFVSCDANGGAAVWNEATAYINGGTFKTMHVGSASDNYGPGCLNNSGTAVITAGTFESVNKRTYAVISTGTITITPAEGKEVIVSGAHGGLAVDSGDAVVNGGSFSSTEYYGLYVSNDGKGADPMKAAVTVNGGTFTGLNYSVWIGSDYNNPVNSSIEIYDGTFTKPLNAQANTREGAVQVYGGTFHHEVPQEYCADGFVPKQNEDGTWGVVTETTYVAQIGETKHATLSEALNAVKDGETIKILAPATVDMAETYAITGKAITLDLNGQTVTWNTSAKEAITVKDGGNLTIQDTSANEAGELAFTSTYTDPRDSTGIYVNPNGTFALQSGTISYTAAKDGRAIYVGSTGTLAMSGGTVKIAGSAKYGVYLSSNNSTNITGGEIILSDTLTGTTLYGLYVYMLADAKGLAIENLTVDASAVPAAQCAYCITGGWNSANNAPVTISGGTYTTNENTLSKAIYYSTVKNLTISGGTFNGVVDSATTITDGTFQKAVKVTDTITGGTFEGNVIAPSGKISGGKFKVVDPPYDWNLADGKSFEQKDGYYCVVDDTNTKVAEVGGVQYATLEEAIKKAQSGQTVELLANATVLERIAIADKNITIDTNGYSVIYSGDADHKSAIIDLEGKAQVVVTGNGTFTFNDAYLDYNGFGYIFRLYDNSVLTIENGTYYAGLTCVQVGDSSAAYIKDGHFSASTDWKDTWWVLNRIDNNNSKFYVSGGTFVNYDPTNSDTESPADNFCTPEYAATPTKDESGNTIYTVVEAEARIGETGYVTLADAIAAAGDNDTITLLADVTEDVVVPAGKNITLDLYGHKITNDSDHTIVNNGTLTITDNSEAKTGTVDNVTHGKGALVNNGTVKLSGGTFERSLEAGTLAGANGNSWYTIVNDGTMIIENGVTVKNKGGFSSMICNSKSGVMGNLTIDGGTFDGGINTVKNDVNSTLTINGGTFTNSAQYVIMNWNKATINGGTFATKDTAYAVLFTSSWQNAPTSVGELVITNGTFTTATEAQKLIVDRYDGSNIGTASISGGTFSVQPDDSYLADGYAPVDNGNGTWGVEMETTYVAEVNSQKYESLIEAVNAAKVNGQTVKLLANVENLQAVEGKDYALLIDNGQSMTLDLNGHKITAEFTNTEGFNLIANYGELTITDTSEGKGGSIEVTENGFAEKSRTSVIYNGYSSGKFTLEAGTLKLTGSADSKKPLYGVYSSGTTVVMNGGAIEVHRLNSYSKYSESWDVYGIYNGNGCQTTVNSGTITVENQGRYNSAYGIYNASGTVSIHGDPNTPYIEANAFNDGTWYEHTLYGKITLYGGKYNMQTDSATGWIEGENNIIIAEGYEKKFNGDRTVSIVKSPVAQIGSTKYDTLGAALDDAQPGDTITLLENVALTDRVIISKNITLNLNDKTISSTADYAFIVNTGSSFTLENGTLSASQNGVFGLTSSTVTLASDAAINAGAAGITATNNLLEQGNATINVYGTIDSEDVAVWGQGPNNTINVDGATITSKYFGVYQNGSFGGTTITIKNSTITDESENGTGIYVSNNGTNAANPDQGFQNLIIENSTITGNTAVEVKFTNVTISGDDTCLTATGTPVDSGMNNNGSVTTGYAFAVTHNGTESSKDAAEGTVTISGGKFTGAVGIQEPSEGETTSATISISGGSFSEKPNKDYLAPYYEATQNTTGDNYWTVDVDANVEAIWITDTDTKAGMLSDLLGEATSGTVQLLKNVTTTGYVTVGTNVTLDLAGKTLDTTNSGTFSVFGKVVDSTEGKGLLKLQEGSYTIQQDNPSLPIYDSTAGGYRLYTYQLTTLRTYEPGTANTVQFWFKLTFTNEEAWELLTAGNENHGITVKSKYQFSGQTASESWFSFNSEFIHWIAAQVVSSQYTQDQLGFYLNVTNTNLLGERTMTVTPAVDSVPSVGTESEQMTYSLNLGE